MVSLAITFILLGIIVKYGKMYFLLAGYNTLPKEEKEKVDIVALASLFRNVMFAMGIIQLAAYFIFRWTKNYDYEYLVVISTTIVGVICLIVLGNSEKYKKKP